MITEEKFVEAIEVMFNQYNEDKNNSKIIGEIFGSEDFNLYDNSKLYNGIIELLRIWFPKDEDGHCEISHFCFFCEFGKIDGETFSEFYNRLIKNKKL